MEKQEKKKRNGLLLKGLLVVVTALVLQIPMLMLSGLVDDRKDLLDEASREIGNSRGGEQTINAPKLDIVYEIKTEENGKSKSERVTRSKRTVDANLKGNADVEILHRSIYEIPVYTASMTIQGKFQLDKADLISHTGDLRLSLPLDDYKGLKGRPVAVINGKEYLFEIDKDGLYVNVPAQTLNADLTLDYVITFKSQGMKSLEFYPNAKNYTVSLTSNYPSPSFKGGFLPSKREVREDGFTAEWVVTEINSYNGYNKSFFVDFHIPANQYQQTERATKYSFLIVLLVFVAIFFVESIFRCKVNIVQYIVTGLSLCLFYLLLLSISEYVSFSIAYLIAAVMTTAALGGYFYGFLKSKTAILFTAAIALLYVFIYILLQMETGSLLVGSLALFVVLGIIMYFTRNSNLFEPQQPAVIE